MPTLRVTARLKAALAAGCLIAAHVLFSAPHALSNALAAAPTGPAWSGGCGGRAPSADAGCARSATGDVASR